MSDFMTVLFFVSIPLLLIAACVSAIVGAYKLAKKSGIFSRTAKPVQKTAKPSVTARPVSGATELSARTFAGEWFASPDVSDLETPAFLRKQAI